MLEENLEAHVVGEDHVRAGSRIVGRIVRGRWVQFRQQKPRLQAQSIAIGSIKVRRRSSDFSNNRNLFLAPLNGRGLRKGKKEKEKRELFYSHFYHTFPIKQIQQCSSAKPDLRSNSFLPKSNYGSKKVDLIING